MAFPPNMSALLSSVGNKVLEPLQVASAKVLGATPQLNESIGVATTSAASSSSPPIVYNDPAISISKFHEVHIVADQDLEKPIRAWMPETVEFSFNSTFDTPFKAATEEVIAKAGMLSSASTAFGYTPSTQFLTTKVWQGTEHLQVTLELEFLADTDPYAEVIVPIAQLAALTLPYEYENAPGLITPGGSVVASNPLSNSQQSGATGNPITNIFKRALPDSLSGIFGTNKSVTSPINSVETNLASSNPTNDRISSSNGVSTGFGSHGVFGSSTSLSDVFGGLNPISSANAASSNTVDGYKDGQKTLPVDVEKGKTPETKEGEITTQSSKSDFTQLNDKLKNRKNIISIKLGNFLTFKDVVIDSVRPSFDFLPDARTGLPIKASVQITFSTAVIPVRNKLMDLFNKANTQVPGLRRTS